MKANTMGGRTLAEIIRRKIGSEANRDFLARMPSFKPATDMPERLLTLLDELDQAEADARKRSRMS